MRHRQRGTPRAVLLGIHGYCRQRTTKEMLAEIAALNI